jgi:iron complex outermembrane receptor protein
LVFNAPLALTLALLGRHIISPRLCRWYFNWQSDGGQWYGGLHLKNLTDEEYLVGGYNFAVDNGDGTFGPGLGGDTTLIGYYGDPRTVSLTVGYRF